MQSNYNRQPKRRRWKKYNLCEPGEGILHHDEGVDFLPANIELAGLETTLVNVMRRILI